MRWSGVLLLCVAVLLAGCDANPAETAQQDVEQRLAGTWLRDYEQDGMHVRRVLVLEPGGRFRELVRGEGPQAGAALEHAGEWRFDGTNLKRRYTSIDGKTPSAPTMPYATFALRFESRNAFVGTDNVRKREVHYRRVEEGTLP